MNYETRKNMLLIFVALIFAVVAAWLATQWMKNRAATAYAMNLALSDVVVAARDVPMGKRIELEDVKIVRSTAASIPNDAYGTPTEVVGQVSKSILFSGEPLIHRRLSQYGGGSALAAVLAPGMRAVTVRVDDVIGVGGFVLPENRVDVVAAHQDGGSFRAETILRNIRVLAIDQRSDPGTNEPLLVRAVTLEVTPEGAEKIAAAAQRGRIQLTLLNPATANAIVTDADTEQPEVVVRAPKLVEAGFLHINAPRLERPQTASPQVTLIRGTQVITRKAE
jgi:pilus assembly protein CpaB